MTAAPAAPGAPARRWQQAEGALVFACALAGLWQFGLPVPLWAAVLLFLLPDLSMAFYALGPRIGAAAYNAAHLYGGGAAALLAGWAADLPWLAAAGALWAGHAGVDRMLGYGLKLPSGFRDTHLGRIGRD